MLVLFRRGNILNSEPIMATFGSRGNRLVNSNKQCKSVFASPEKVRELLNEGVVSEENRSNGYVFLKRAHAVTLIKKGS